MPEELLTVVCSREAAFLNGLLIVSSNSISHRQAHGAAFVSLEPSVVSSLVTVLPAEACHQCLTVQQEVWGTLVSVGMGLFERNL